MAVHKKYLRSFLGAIGSYVHKIPVVLRAGLIHLLVQFVVTVPLWIFPFPAQSDPLFIQVSLIVFSYLFISPVLAGWSYVSRELKEMGIVKWVFMLAWLYLSICVSRLNIFNISEIEFFTLQALQLSIFPFVLFLVVALVRSRATTND